MANNKTEEQNLRSKEIKNLKFNGKMDEVLNQFKNSTQKIEY